jgi:hypothetical protein
MRKRYSEKDSYTKQLTSYIANQQNQGMMQMPSNQTVAQYVTQGHAVGPQAANRAQYSNTINASNINVGKRGHLSQNEQFLKNTYGPMHPAAGGGAARG